MAAYRYLLCDLLTDTLVTTLPLTGVTFDRRISRTGSLQATLSATTPQLVAAARLVQRYTGRCALWVLRDNTIWWGGIIWTAPASQGQRGPVELAITAATFDSYAAHRLLDADRNYDQVDAGVIVPDLWRAIQADPRGDIGVQAPDQPMGVLLDRDYLADDQAYVGTMITEIGDVLAGPEHTIDTYLDPAGTRTKRLRLAATLGMTTATTLFQRAVGGGGRLLEWNDTVDALDGGTTFTLRGDGATTPRVYADTLLDQGWPLLDVTADRLDIDDDAQLAQQAQVLAADRAGSIRTRGYTVQVGDTGWSPNRLGDPVRIKIADAWHDPIQMPGSSDFTVRPVGVKVTPTSNTGAETVELLFGDD